MTLRLQRADVAAAPTQDGGTLMVGMLIGKDPQPEPGTGSPSRLRVSPFATPTGNVFVRAHEALLNKLAAESVPLVEQFIQDKIDPQDPTGRLDIDVDEISIDLREPNDLHVTVDAKFGNLCGPGPFNFIDLDFDLTADVEFDVFNGRLRYQRPAG